MRLLKRPERTAGEIERERVEGERLRRELEDRARRAQAWLAVLELETSIARGRA